MVGFGQEGLPNTQRPVGNENTEPLELESLSEDSDGLTTPNVGSPCNHAGCMSVKLVLTGDVLTEIQWYSLMCRMEKGGRSMNPSISYSKCAPIINSKHGNIHISF